MSDDHWTDELVNRVAMTDDGMWCSKSGLKALACLSEFTHDPDAQADFCGLLIDEIETLREALAQYADPRNWIEFEWQGACVPTRIAKEALK
jgi:hypothetical protein